MMVKESLAPPPAPFFFATQSNNGAIGIAGKQVCSFGHKIPTDRGGDDGIFAEWAWDGRRLLARNDRYGFYPLFVYHKQNQFGISPSIAALVAQGADTSFDYPALAVALRLGQFIGDDTPLRHVRALAPNENLEWNGRELKLSGGYSSRPLTCPNRDDAIQTYLELFQRSIRRRAPSDDNFSVPLSGGRDSRHILFELLRSGYRPAFCLTAKTFPEDVRIASALCRHLGLEHVVVEQPTAPYVAEVQKNWVTNFGVDQGSYPIAINESLMERGITAIYDGIAGDVLSAGLFLEPALHELYREQHEQRIASRILVGYDDSVLKLILDADFLRRCNRELALERLTNEVRRHFDRHNPVTSFYFWNRTRRKIALTPYAMLSGVRFAYAPYLDHELFDFLATLPAELLIDHTFHTEAISRGFPQWAHLPYEDKSAAAYEFAALHARFAKEFAREALYRRSRLLRTGSLRVRLALSTLSDSFGAGNHWFLQRAAWVYQLGVLTDVAA